MANRTAGLAISGLIFIFLTLQGAKEIASAPVDISSANSEGTARQNSELEDQLKQQSGENKSSEPASSSLPDSETPDHGDEYEPPIADALDDLMDNIDKLVDQESPPLRYSIYQDISPEETAEIRGRENDEEKNVQRRKVSDGKPIGMSSEQMNDDDEDQADAHKGSWSPKDNEIEIQDGQVDPDGELQKEEESQRTNEENVSKAEEAQQKNNRNKFERESERYVEEGYPFDDNDLPLLEDDKEISPRNPIHAQEHPGQEIQGDNRPISRSVVGQ